MTYMRTSACLFPNYNFLLRAPWPTGSRGAGVQAYDAWPLLHYTVITIMLQTVVVGI